MTNDERKMLEAMNKQLSELRQSLNVSGSTRRAPLSKPDMAFVVGEPEPTDYTPAWTQPGEIETSTYLWDTFNSDRHPHLAEGVKTVVDWVNNRIEQGGAIILAGGYGSGKSHIAHAICEMYGPAAVYCNESELLAAIRNSYDRGSESEMSIFRRHRMAKILIYDDLGVYRTDSIDWLQNIYYRLFDDCGALLLTTNLPLADGEGRPIQDRLGRRVYSRVMGKLDTLDYYVDLFDVPDYRLRNFR